MISFAPQKNNLLLKSIIIIASRMAMAAVSARVAALLLLLISTANAKSDGGSVDTVITRQIARGITAPVLSMEATILAMIAARQQGDLDHALKIGADALAENPQGLPPPILIYELAYTLALKNDCARALPLFRYLRLKDMPIDPDVLRLCPDETQWQHRLNVVWAYEGNLGGVTPRRLVTPAQGSSLDLLLGHIESSLQGVTLPEQLEIGQDTISGQTLTVMPFWYRQWHEANQVTTVQLKASAKFTAPKGYEEYGLSGQITRRIADGPFIRIAKTDMDWRQHHQGDGNPTEEEFRLSLFSGIEWPLARPIWIGTDLGQGHLETAQNPARPVYITHYGIRAGLGRSNQPPSAPAPRDWLNPAAWSWTGQALRRQSQDPFYGVDEVYFSGKSRSWRLSPHHNMRVHLGYRWSRPHETRPWLNAHHVRHDYSLALVASRPWSSHNKGQFDADHSHLQVMVQYRWTRSKDSLLPRQNVHLTIQYSH